jgi:ATP phosphoribosyltransferase
VLIANRAALKTRPKVLSIAHTLIEMMEAHLRGEAHYMVTANMRASDPERIAHNLFAHPDLGGLQGPTIAPVYTRSGERWHAINIVVRQDRLLAAVNALRSVGGSGVIVSPVKYIFEEEPERSRRLNENL